MKSPFFSDMSPRFPERTMATAGRTVFVSGMIVLLGVAPAVYALSVDRYLLPWLREELHRAPHMRHATAH